MGLLKVQLVAFKRQNYTQNDVKMAILQFQFCVGYCDHRGLLCVKFQQQKSLINA